MEIRNALVFSFSIEPDSRKMTLIFFSFEEVQKVQSDENERGQVTLKNATQLSLVDLLFLFSAWAKVYISTMFVFIHFASTFKV